jgi:CubicO group peptidase (beta-lactamase class C family)
VSAELGELIDQIAADVGLSGVVRVNVRGTGTIERTYGLAHRGLGIANTPSTQFSIASGSKCFTALAIMSLVERGELTLRTTARSMLGSDLPLIDDRVTVEHLLAHRSGIGDYLDEDALDKDALDEDADHYLAVPVQALATTEQFLRVLDGYPMKGVPGEQFAYNNGGYVVLALIAERVSGVPFHDLVGQRVCGPAGMIDTAFLRSDELPGRAALGYLHDDGLRTNVFHLPVRASGDGGAYTTVADVHAMWDALFAGRIVSRQTFDEMIRPRSALLDGSLRYGLGFWLQELPDAVSIHGFDAGSGFVSVRDPDGRFTYTVVSNKGSGAWPVSQRLGELVAGLQAG